MAGRMAFQKQGRPGCLSGVGSPLQPGGCGQCLPGVELVWWSLCHHLPVCHFAGESTSKAQFMPYKKEIIRKVPSSSPWTSFRV